MFMHGRVICHITQRRWHLSRVWHNVSMIADSGCYASLRGRGTGDGLLADYLAVAL